MKLNWTGTCHPDAAREIDGKTAARRKKKISTGPGAVSGARASVKLKETAGFAEEDSEVKRPKSKPPTPSATDEFFAMETSSTNKGEEIM